MLNKNKRPLMRPNHLPLILLGAAMTLYGLVMAVAGSWFSNQAMRGLITAGAYRGRLSAFEQGAGLVAGVILVVLFIWCAMQSVGGVRVAFAIGVLAATAPLLAGRTERLLFDVLGCPP